MKNWKQFAALVLAVLLLLAPSVRAQSTSVLLATQAKPPGSNGQLLYNNAGAVGAEDPIVSFNYVNLFTTIGATVTQTSSTVRVPTFSQYGTLFITWASITGSPSGCTIQIKSADSLGNLVNNGSALSVSPANGSTSQTFTPAVTATTSAGMQAVYACSAYPSAGTLSLDFVPSVSPLPIGPVAPGNFTTPVCTAAMTGTTSTVTIAAPAPGLHNYVTALIVTNSHATVGTFVLVQDGSGGTTLWEGYAAATGGGFTVSFPNGGLRQPTAATGLYVADVTTGANVIACATGYTAP